MPTRTRNLLALRTEALKQFRIAFRSGNGSIAEELRLEIERLERLEVALAAKPTQES